MSSDANMAATPTKRPALSPAKSNSHHFTVGTGVSCLMTTLNVWYVGHFFTFYAQNPFPVRFVTLGFFYVRSVSCQAADPSYQEICLLGATDFPILTWCYKMGESSSLQAQMRKMINHRLLTPKRFKSIAWLLDPLPDSQPRKSTPNFQAQHTKI